MSKIIGIGSDHAGFLLKKDIVLYLKKREYEVRDMGVTEERPVDYPDFAHDISRKLQEGIINFGILICGTGIGMSIVANRYKGVRAALCWEVSVAKSARTHNDANILVLPARFMKKEIALECVDIFLREKFEGGRHLSRIEKIEK